MTTKMVKSDFLLVKFNEVDYYFYKKFTIHFYKSGHDVYFFEDNTS